MGIFWMGRGARLGWTCSVLRFDVGAKGYRHFFVIDKAAHGKSSLDLTTVQTVLLASTTNNFKS